MRKITAGLFITLDGVIEAPEQWNPPYYNDEMTGIVMGQMADADTQLYGRRSYELFRTVFTGPQTPPHAQMMTSVPKIVVSTTLEHPDWGPTTLISSEVTAELTKLKQQPGKNISIGASGTLVRFCSPKDCSTNSACWSTRSWSAPASTCSREAPARCHSRSSSPGPSATVSPRSATHRPGSRPSGALTGR